LISAPASIFSRNAATDGIRRSCRASAMTARSRKNIVPACKMIGCPRASSIKCARLALLALHFDHARLQAQLAGGLGRSIALFARKCVARAFGEGRPRQFLASDLDPLGGEFKLTDENAGYIASWM